MATYLYETVSAEANEPVTQFEIRQSMKEEPLTHHPETGQPIRRVISGGFGLMGVRESTPAPAPSSGGCGSACGCHPH